MVVNTATKGSAKERKKEEKRKKILEYVKDGWLTPRSIATNIGHGQALTIIYEILEDLVREEIFESSMTKTKNVSSRGRPGIKYRRKQKTNRLNRSGSFFIITLKLFSSIPQTLLFQLFLFGSVY